MLTDRVKKRIAITLSAAAVALSMWTMYVCSLEYSSVANTELVGPLATVFCAISIVILVRAVRSNKDGREV